MDLKNYMVGNDQGTIEQIDKIVNSPAFEGSKVRIMPDAHAGKGCVVGTTATFTDKIVPNIVGVDIACRVTAFKIPNAIDLEKLDKVIHKVVPAGFNIHSDEQITFDYSKLRCWDKISNHDRIRKSCGTLGGGNHYIEVDTDGDSTYLVIHCGSRNLGVQVCNYYQNLAILAQEERIKEMKAEQDAKIARCKKDNIPGVKVGELVRKYRDERAAAIIDEDLCYLEGQDMEDYLNDMKVCNEWSKTSHFVIFYNIAMEMGWRYDGEISCIHNYVDVEHKIIRKGAIAAYEDTLCLIPLNMRDGIAMVRAKGNPDWNYSLPHGCGRFMSRGEARRSIDLAAYKDTMSGIYSSCVQESTLDEAPFAYKDYRKVLAKIAPNADIIGIYKPVYNFKAV